MKSSIGAIQAGDRRALARAISLIEDSRPEGRALLADAYRATGRAHIIGVTGAPGTGKSSLVNVLAQAYRRNGQTVGIIAIDPSSPFSGGALLGDRLRMNDLAGDPGVFIRSMASRGSLGGLARATADVIQLLDAAGFKRVLVETVGAGQSEVEIAGAAHTTIVVEAPGMGDEVQAFKAGLLEIADVLVVNKADREDADRTVLALQAMQALADSGPAMGHYGPQDSPRDEAGAQQDGGWLPPIVKTVAVTGAGVETLRSWIEAHAAYLRSTGAYAERELVRAEHAVRHILSERLTATLLAGLPAGLLESLIEEIVQRKLDPYSAADRLLSANGRNAHRSTFPGEGE